MDVDGKGRKGSFGMPSCIGESGRVLSSRLLVGLARWLVVQLARSGTVGYWLLLFTVRIIISGPRCVCVSLSTG